jgi:hypothetical protein
MIVEEKTITLKWWERISKRSKYHTFHISNYTKYFARVIIEDIQSYKLTNIGGKMKYLGAGIGMNAHWTPSGNNNKKQIEYINQINDSIYPNNNLTTIKIITAMYNLTIEMRYNGEWYKVIENKLCDSRKDYNIISKHEKILKNMLRSDSKKYFGWNSSINTKNKSYTNTIPYKKSIYSENYLSKQSDNDELMFCIA